MILCLETATSLCSVALADRDRVIALKESSEERSHATALTLFVQDILKETGIKPHQLEAVAVTKGPGSYTGLRIGVSAAKGLAYATPLPLIGIDTTLTMFHGFLEQKGQEYEIGSDDFLCPAIDARRMEIYYSVYKGNGMTVKDIRAGVVDAGFLEDLPAPSRLFIFGDGAAKCRGVAERKNLIIDTGFRISASYMRTAAYRALDEKRFEDVAYFEPFYLKDFITTKPVKNILG